MVKDGLTYTAGDLFAAVQPGEGKNVSIIAHVCNNKGAWGAGFVVPLGMKYPKALKEYENLTQQYRKLPADLPLGHTQLVEVDTGLHVANMIAQNGFPSRERPVAIDYNSLAQAMYEAVNSFINTGNKVTIYAPLFGAGLGGGDWAAIENMIKTHWLRRGVVTKIFYIPGKTPAGWTPPKEE